MDIVDQLRLLEAGNVGPFPRSQTFRAARETIERLRSIIKGAEIALVRDGNAMAAAELLIGAHEHPSSAPTIDDAPSCGSENDYRQRQAKERGIRYDSMGDYTRE